MAWREELASILGESASSFLLLSSRGQIGPQAGLAPNHDTKVSGPVLGQQGNKTEYVGELEEMRKKLTLAVNQMSGVHRGTQQSAPALRIYLQGGLR